MSECVKTVLKTLGVTLWVVFVAAYCVVSLGYVPTHADALPPSLEKWAAHKALDAAKAREAPRTKAPLPVDEANLTVGLLLYKKNCLVCHGAADGEASNVASGLYQKPPQFAYRDVSDDPVGQTFWIIKHGVRLTGMPAFSYSLRVEQIWQVALFLKQMDALPPLVQKKWESLPSAAE
jgi:thiosulfate dehydrogenase